MQTTVYPSNFDYSDDYFSLSSTSMPIFISDDVWEFEEMLPSNDTQPDSELDDVFALGQQHDSFSSDTLTDDEVMTTPPPSSPNPYNFVKPESTPMKPEAAMPFDYQTLLQMRNNQLVAQYQQQLQQYQFWLQHRLLETMQTPPFVPAGVSLSLPVQPAAPCVAYDMNATAYSAPVGSFPGSETVALTSLDASHFGSSAVAAPKLKSIPVDISGNLSDAQYSKIFKKYHLQLQLDSHPVMTEQDLLDIKANGRMYFLKNVKTIVPKVGPWKFNAHISHRRTDERQYNIPGMAVTCKVKEWLTDDGLWRLYHYKKGKTVKPKICD